MKLLVAENIEEYMKEFTIEYIKDFIGDLHYEKR
jgi:hypothetical protein